MSERPPQEYYAGLEARLTALLPALQKAVPLETWRWFEEWVRAGEYGLAVEVAAEGLTSAPEPPRELCRQLLSVAESMDLDSETVVSLRSACR